MTASVWSPSGGSVVLSNLNRVSQEWTAGVGATTFPLSITPYTPGAQNLEVFKNGAKLLPSQVTEQGAGTSFVIAACAGGEKIEAVVYPATSNSFEALALNAQNSATAAQNSATAAAASAASIAQFTGAAIGGNLAFTSTGQRIVGDLSNALITARLLFQTSIVNGASILGVIPNGTNTTSGMMFFNGSDPTNAAYCSVVSQPTEVSFRSTYVGSASFLPITFHTGGSESFRINADKSGALLSGNYAGLKQLSITNSDGGATSGAACVLNTDAGYLLVTKYSVAAGGHTYIQTTGNSLYIGTNDAKPVILRSNNIDRFTVDAAGNSTHVSPAGGLGYGTGAGGTVTQATNKATAVTLNKPVGVITMNAASLAAATAVTFTLNNSLVTSADIFIPCLSAFASANYSIRWNVGAGAVNITLKNETAGALAEAVIINFAVIKGATS